MTARIRLPLCAALVAVLLAGCSQNVPPPSFTEAQLVASYHERVDAAWVNTGLVGQIERPVVDGDIGERLSHDNVSGFVQCLEGVGPLSWGEVEATNAPFFESSSGGVLSAEQQLGAYRCFAENPYPSGFVSVPVTDDQKDYLYDYYVRWVVPCLHVHDYQLDLMPTRDEYIDVNGVWNPYFSVVSETQQVDMLELSELCGNPYADLDVEHPDWP